MTPKDINCVLSYFTSWYKFYFFRFKGSPYYISFILEYIKIVFFIFKNLTTFCKLSSLPGFMVEVFILGMIWVTDRHAQRFQLLKPISTSTLVIIIAVFVMVSISVDPSSRCRFLYFMLLTLWYIERMCCGRFGVDFCMEEKWKIFFLSTCENILHYIRENKKMLSCNSCNVQVVWLLPECKMESIWTIWILILSVFFFNSQ